MSDIQQRIRLVRENIDIEDRILRNYSWGCTVGEDGIAIVRLAGSLSQSGWFYFSSSSYRTLTARLESLMNDESVKAVIVDIDSPGGDSAGLFDATDVIWNMQAEKPIYAYVAGGMACSAAYILAAAMGRIYSSEASEIGCCGVQCVATDSSEYLKELGFRQKIFRSKNAKKKNLSPFTKEGEAEIQKTIDELEDYYYNRLSLYRGIDKDECIDHFGNGLTFHAEEALERGMIDGVCTLDELFTMVRKDAGEENAKNNSAILSSQSEGINGGQDMDKPNANPNLTEEQVLSYFESNPALLAKLRTDAVSAERARVSKLEEVRTEATSSIIDKALEEGKNLDEIAMDLISAMREENKKLSKENAELREKASAVAPIAAQAESTQRANVPGTEPKELSAAEIGRNNVNVLFPNKEAK